MSQRKKGYKKLHLHLGICIEQGIQLSLLSDDERVLLAIVALDLKQTTEIQEAGLLQFHFICSPRDAKTQSQEQRRISTPKEPNSQVTTEK